MRGPVPGLTPSAGWVKKKGFALDFLTPTTLNLENGITTPIYVPKSPGVPSVLQSSKNRWKHMPNIGAGVGIVEPGLPNVLGAIH